MSEFTTKENKYFVLKLDDLAEYTTTEERLFLDKVAVQIAEGRRRDKREPYNRYVVCNQDEPYAENVWRAILNGEDAKQVQARRNQIG